MADSWVKKFLGKIKSEFLGELFPGDFSCFNCGREIFDSNKYHLCDKCLSHIDFITHSCEKCGDSVNSFSSICDNCKDHKRSFDKVVCSAMYKGTAVSLVYKFKYGKNKFVADSIYAFMSQTFGNCAFKDEVDCVCFVPISAKRFKKRGFNQAQILAEKLCTNYEKPLLSGLFSRIKETTSQAKLHKAKRFENLKGAFTINNKDQVKGKNVLIVDDIITTGATLDELSKVLKRNGANKVFALTFCHSGSLKREDGDFGNTGV